MPLSILYHYALSVLCSVLMPAPYSLAGAAARNGMAPAPSAANGYYFR
jgi:hypothetical protein